MPRNEGYIRGKLMKFSVTQSLIENDYRVSYTAAGTIRYHGELGRRTFQKWINTVRKVRLLLFKIGQTYDEANVNLFAGYVAGVRYPVRSKKNG